MAPKLSSHSAADSMDLKSFDTSSLLHDDDTEDEFERELRRASVELGQGSASGNARYARGTIRGWDRKSLAIALLSLLLVVSVGRSALSGDGSFGGSGDWPAGLQSSAGLVEETQHSSSPSFGAAVDASQPPAKLSSKKERLPAWVDPKVAMVDFENIEGEWDAAPLAALCKDTVWLKGRYIASDDDQGGVGNIRNTVLTQLRYAIMAGAGFVQPSFMIRSPVVTSDLEELHRGGRSGMSFFFDYDFFKATLKEHCPQLEIVDDIYHVPNVEKATFPELFNPPDLREMATGNPRDPRPHPGIQNVNVDTWREDFDLFYGKPDPSRPVIHRLTRPLFQFPVAFDSAAFWTQFGRVLKLHPVAQVLASQITYELEKKADTYFGSHLRLEKDVGTAWGSFDEQASVHLERFLAKRNGNVIYVACGDPAPLAQFKQFIHDRAPHMSMATKQSLLAKRPKALAKLNSLHFDQQALVDYLILLRSSYLVGNAMSSFSTNLSLRRHLTLGGPMKDQAIMEGGEDDRGYLTRPEGSKFIRDTSWP